MKKIFIVFALLLIPKILCAAGEESKKHQIEKKESSVNSKKQRPSEDNVLALIYQRLNNRVHYLQKIGTTLNMLNANCAKHEEKLTALEKISSANEDANITTVDLDKKHVEQNDSVNPDAESVCTITYEDNLIDNVGELSVDSDNCIVPKMNFQSNNTQNISMNIPMSIAPAVMSFIYNNNCITARYDDGSIKLWDLAGKTQKTLLELPKDINIIAFAYHPKNADMFFISTGKKVKLIKLGSRVWSSKENFGADVLCFCYEQKLPCELYSGHADGKITVWDFSSGARIKVLDTKLGSEILGLHLTKDANLIALSKNKLKIINLKNNKSKTVLIKPGKKIKHNYCELCSSNDILAIGGSLISLYDLKSGQFIKHLDPSEHIVKFAFGKVNQNLLVSGTLFGKIQIWDLNSNECLGVLSGHTGRITGLEIDENNRIISSAEDGTIRLWTPMGNSWQQSEILR